MKMAPVYDISHGYDFNEIQLEIANELALSQFKKPVNRRVDADDISELVKKISKGAAKTTVKSL